MSTVRADNFGNRIGTRFINADTLVSGTVKTWAYFNGIGTIVVYDSFNVSSITDVGTGQYGMNTAVAYPSAARATLANAFEVGLGGRMTNAIPQSNATTYIIVEVPGTGVRDADRICVVDVGKYN